MLQIIERMEATGCTTNKPPIFMTNFKLRIKVTFSYDVHASDLPIPNETGRQSGVRSCSMPGLLEHLVQELKAGTVHWIPHEHVGEWTSGKCTEVNFLLLSNGRTFARQWKYLTGGRRCYQAYRGACLIVLI